MLFDSVEREVYEKPALEREREYMYLYIKWATYDGPLSSHQL